MQSPKRNVDRRIINGTIDNACLLKKITKASTQNYYRTCPQLLLRLVEKNSDIFVQTEHVEKGSKQEKLIYRNS